MLHAAAMFLAVPTLSPVSIHTLTDAARKSARISGTPSCSLSSMAVAPCSDSSHSSSACIASIALASFRSEAYARCHSLSRAAPAAPEN
eukprot:772653-Pleurochrysis_carterae.AAC.1